MNHVLRQCWALAAVILSQAACSSEPGDSTVASEYHRNSSESAYSKAAVFEMGRFFGSLGITYCDFESNNKIYQEKIDKEAAIIQNGGKVFRERRLDAPIAAVKNAYFFYEVNNSVAKMELLYPSVGIKGPKWEKVEQMVLISSDSCDASANFGARDPSHVTRTEGGEDYLQTFSTERIMRNRPCSIQDGGYVIEAPYFIGADSYQSWALKLDSNGNVERFALNVDIHEKHQCVSSMNPAPAGKEDKSILETFYSIRCPYSASRSDSFIISDNKCRYFSESGKTK